MGFLGFLLVILPLAAAFLPPPLLRTPPTSLLFPVRRLSPVTLALAEADVSEAEMVAQLDDEAIALDDSLTSVKPTRGPDGRLQPILTLPGDSLETTSRMVAITAASTVLAAGLVARAFAMSSTPLWPLLGVALGGVAGEMFTGCFHWATDNYGRLETPVVGFACAAFQGHHLAPWTISHRSLWNNVYKIGSASIPLMLCSLALLPPTGTAFVAVMLYCQLCAQEFHRWSHTPPALLQPWQRRLQNAGVALPFKEHCAHHKPPFERKYCILTGGLNQLLDTEPIHFWRRLEALVFRLNGQEPHSWEDPKVKALALSL